MRFIVLSLLLVITFARPSFLGRDTICSVERELCGHELAQKSCCSGFMCILPENGAPGATGFCERQYYCLRQDEPCEIGLEGTIDCCGGVTCQPDQGAHTGVKGVKGTCKSENMNVAFASICSVQGESCGHELAQKSCCSGFMCILPENGAPGATGFCERQYYCLREEEPCEIGLEGIIYCCGGLTCQPEQGAHTGVKGVKGTCKSKTMNISKEESQCAVRGEFCGPDLGIDCCSGYKCNPVPDHPVGHYTACVPEITPTHEPAPVMKITEHQCAVKGEFCGPDLGTDCCSGLKCVPVPDHPVGHYTACVPETQDAATLEDVTK